MVKALLDNGIGYDLNIWHRERCYYSHICQTIDWQC